MLSRAEWAATVGDPQAGHHVEVGVFKPRETRAHEAAVAVTTVFAHFPVALVEDGVALVCPVE